MHGWNARTRRLWVHEAFRRAGPAPGGTAGRPRRTAAGTGVASLVWRRPHAGIAHDTRLRACAESSRHRRPQQSRPQQMPRMRGVLVGPPQSNARARHPARLSWGVRAKKSGAAMPRSFPRGPRRGTGQRRPERPPAPARRGGPPLPEAALLARARVGARVGALRRGAPSGSWTVNGAISGPSDDHEGMGLRPALRDVGPARRRLSGMDAHARRAPATRRFGTEPAHQPAADGSGQLIDAPRLARSPQAASRQPAMRRFRPSRPRSATRGRQAETRPGRVPRSTPAPRRGGSPART